MFIRGIGTIALGGTTTALAGCSKSADVDSETPTTRELPTFDATHAGLFAEIEPLERSIYNATNEFRDQHGYEPLRYNEKLAGIARLHSRNMALKGFFGHTDHKDRSHVDRAELFGYTSETLGENLYKSELRREWDRNEIAHRPVDWWLGSTSHRSAMFSDLYTESGIGAYITESLEMYVTALYSAENGK